MTGRPLASTCGALLVGCGVTPAEPAGEVREVAEVVACESDDECSDATCDRALGACVADQGDLGTLMLEITPATSDARFGGLKIYKIVDGLEAAAEDGLTVDVPQPVRVQGGVLAHPKQQLCTGKAADTLPVELEFRPRQWVLGLDAPMYLARTAPVDFEYRFSDLELPAGVYDIYVRPLDEPSATSEGGAVTPSCAVVPQLFRSVTIEQQGSVSLELQQSEPIDLTVRIPFEDRLEGWAVDVIHPTRGERISTRVTLKRENARELEGALVIDAALQYSLASGDDFVAADQQLVRLTPAADSVEPTTLFHRSGLEVFQPGQAVLAAEKPFQPVTFRAWVWANGEPDAVVPATVQFTATQLKGVSEGVFINFSRTVDVGETGELELSLLPGTYRVRTVPRSVVEGLSALESFVTVREPDDGETDPVQAGQVIALPRGASVRGGVQLPHGVAAAGVKVDAVPASLQSACLASGNDAAGACGALLPDVLRAALAQDAFRPRSVSALVDVSGHFELSGVDCGSCEPEHAALFDLFVRPAASSGHPWRFLRAVPVSGDKDLGEMTVTPGVVHRGSLTFGGADPLPGALVRAYVLVDSDGKSVRDPADLEYCAGSAAEPSSGDCVASAFQVAETRVNESGQFVLPLPTRFD